MGRGIIIFEVETPALDGTVPVSAFADCALATEKLLVKKREAAIKAKKTFFILLYKVEHKLCNAVKFKLKKFFITTIVLYVCIC